ncbi:MAG: glycosyl hydrolase family 28-related protein, partial [Pseudomonadota bacterium]
DNDVGINAPKGNVMVRNSRFERSRFTDLFLSTHSHSARRVLSVNSRAFIRTHRGPGALGAITVEDCRVDGWTDPDGAIISALRGPITVFDCEFSNPPNSNPPIVLAQPRYMRQPVLVANVKSSNPLVDAGPNGRVLHISAPSAEVGPSLNQRFLRSAKLPIRYFDIKTDCGAKGDGHGDDADAINDCISRAKSSRNSAVYIPSGRYLVGQPLDVSGEGYTLVGSGWHSQVIAKNSQIDSVLNINDANRVMISQLAVGGSPKLARVYQTNSIPGYVRYEHVFGYAGNFDHERAFRFQSLAPLTIVHAGMIDGNQVFSNTGAAITYLGMSISTRLRVDGSESFAGGHLGIGAMFTCCRPWPLEVRNNQSLTVADWYNEQTRFLAHISGESDDPPGEVVLNLKKAESEDPLFARLDNYRGRLSFSGGFFGKYKDDRPRRLFQSADSQASVSFYGNMFWYEQPELPSSAHLTGNIIQGVADKTAMVPEKMSPLAEREIVAAINAFRRLGQLDRYVNYCEAIR